MITALLLIMILFSLSALRRPAAAHGPRPRTRASSWLALFLVCGFAAYAVHMAQTI